MTQHCTPQLSHSVPQGTETTENWLGKHRSEMSNQVCHLKELNGLGCAWPEGEADGLGNYPLQRLVGW